jgi:hypothetical protein
LDRDVSAPEGCSKAHHDACRAVACTQAEQAGRANRRVGCDGIEQTVKVGFLEESCGFQSIHDRRQFMVDLGSWHDIVLLGGAVLVMVVICSLEGWMR